MSIEAPVKRLIGNLQHMSVLTVAYPTFVRGSSTVVNLTMAGSHSVN